MPPCARANKDVCTGHDLCPPRPIASGSENVKTNGFQQARFSDPFEQHGCPDHPSHGATITSGSGDTYVNGLKMARKTDTVSCDSACVNTGSGNVLCNGK